MLAAIEVENLKKSFGATKAVDDISFRVEKGEIFGFLGPNGAGKTTTIRCLMDFIRPTSGRMLILGLNAQTQALEVKRKVGYLSADDTLYPNWTGEDHIAFVRKARNLRSDELNELLNRLEFDPKKKIRFLSSGNKRKLGLILALLSEPELLILDEPTSSLDPLLQNTVYDILQERCAKGASVFISSHNLPEVERICHRVAIIRQGELVAVENIDELRRKRLHLASVRFESAYDLEEFKNATTQIVESDSRRLVLRIKGDINPLLERLARYEVTDIEITHASLEDIFMSFYKS